MKRYVKEIVNSNTKKLSNSDKSFSALFDIIFNFDGVLAEYGDGYRVNKLTYKQVREKIISAAFEINRRLGANHSYIGLYSENSIEWIIFFWAILMSGNKPYLMNCRYPKSLLNGAIKTLGIKYIIGENQPPLETEFIPYSSFTLSGNSDYTGVWDDEIALSTSATSLNEDICIYKGSQISEQVLNTEYVLSRNSRIR